MNGALDVVSYASAKEFMTVCSPMLLRKEIQNNLMYGFVNREITMPPKTQSTFLCIKQGDLVLAAAYCGNTGLPMTVVAPENPDGRAIAKLLQFLSNENMNVPGLSAQKTIADMIEPLWETLTPCKMTYKREMHVMRVDADTLKLPSKKPSGGIRVATTDDSEALLVAAKEFFMETNQPGKPPHREFIKNKFMLGVRHWVWEDNRKVVSTVQCSRRTPNALYISAVHTIKKYRHHGYASALVHAVASIMLMEAKQACLFADMKAEIPCHMYRKLGFKPLTQFNYMAYSYDPK